MTERRAIITRGWRPVGAPARRIDDCLEVPVDLAPVVEPPVRVERRDMESRMENWVRWCSTWGGYPRGGDEDSAARACRIAYEAKFGPAPTTGASVERREINEQDAMLIERSLWQLPPVQRDILRLHYVRRRAWFDICRIVGIAVRRHGFVGRLEEAQQSIAAIVEQGQQNS